MKLVLFISFLAAVQLSSSQTFRTERQEECHSEDHYCKERDFYYQGRDHYYPGKGSYPDHEHSDKGYYEFSHQGQDYYHRQRNYPYHEGEYYPKGYYYQGNSYNYYPEKEGYYQRYPYPQRYPYHQHQEPERKYSPYKFEYFSSCKEILHEYPETPSGFYYITSGPDKFRKVYCEMEKEFCGMKGWERFYYMDFVKNVTHTCPGSFKKSFRNYTKPSSTMGKPFEMGKQFYCGGTVDDGCTTARFHLDDTRYSEICAKIGGYQYGTPTAFKPYVQKDYETFMDGVYFTYGEDTKYLWGYAVGSYKHYRSEYKNKLDKHLIDMCPDVHPTYQGKVPPFVENYYYCDSGAYEMSTNDSTRFFYKNRLFEGKGCEYPNYTCMRSGQPWFYRKLPVYFKDYIEMRSCNDDSVMTKDLRMDNIEIYLR